MTDTIYRSIRYKDRIMCAACGGLLEMRVQGFNCILHGHEVICNIPLFIIKCGNSITVGDKSIKCGAFNEVVL
jgi:hypothetical protein